MIVTVEASFAGSKCGLLVQLLDFAIEDIEGGAECARSGYRTSPVMNGGRVSDRFRN